MPSHQRERGPWLKVTWMPNAIEPALRPDLRVLEYHSRRPRCRPRPELIAPRAAMRDRERPQVLLGRGRQLPRIPVPALLFFISVRAQRRTLAPGARKTAQSHARSRVAHERSNAKLPTNSGARAAPHARAGRAADSSVACSEPKRARSLGWPDHDQPTRWRTYDSRPNGRVLSTGFSASGPAPPSERAQTRVSSRAPKAPRVPLNAAG